MRCPPCCVETLVWLRVFPSSRYVPPPVAVWSTRWHDGFSSLGSSMFNSQPISTDLKTRAEATGRLTPLTLAPPIPYFNHSPIPTRFAGSVSHSPDSGTSHPYFNHSPIPTRFAGSVSRDTDRHLLFPTSNKACPLPRELPALSGAPPAYLMLLCPEGTESDRAAAATLTRHHRTEWKGKKEGRGFPFSLPGRYQMNKDYLKRTCFCLQINV